MFKLTSSLF